jgi:hypothetical protein
MTSRNVGFHQVPANKMFSDDALYSFDKNSAPKKAGSILIKTPAAIRMATSMAINNGAFVNSHVPYR